MMGKEEEQPVQKYEQTVGIQRRKRSNRGKEIAHRYVAFLNRFKIPILLFWLAAAGVSAWAAPGFISKTSDAFDPPNNSNATIANNLYQAAFPQSTVQSSLALYISFNLTSPTSSSHQFPATILCGALQNFTLQLQWQVFNVGAPKYWNVTTGIHSNSTGLSGPSEFITSFTSYYSLMQDELPAVAINLLSPTKNSTIIAIVLNAAYTSNSAIDFSNWLIDEITTLQDQTQTANLSMVLTGVPAFINVMQDSAEADLALMDGIVMPIAMLILAYILRTLRLMILPVLSIGTSTAVSFALMYIIASYMNVTSIASSLMMSILVAMSIDYSLFLLSRYREHLFVGGSPKEAVEVMIYSAGHTILVSGFTLAGCFLGLVVLPLMMMKSLGIACAIAISTTLLVNVTLIPCALLLFCNFFGRCVEPFTCFGYVVTVGSRPQRTECEGERKHDSGHDSDSGEEAEEEEKEREPLLSNSTVVADIEKHSFLDRNLRIQKRLGKKLRRIEAEIGDDLIKNSFWYRWGSILLQFPYNILIIFLVCGFTIYFNLYALNPNTTDGLYLDLPRSYLVTKAYNQMCEEFGYGSVYPYNLLMSVNPNTTSTANITTVYSNEFFTAAVGVLSELVPLLPNTTSSNFAGITKFGSFSEVQDCLLPNSSSNNILCPYFLYAIQTLVNPNATATNVLVQLSWDPLGANGNNWLRAIRGALGPLQDKYGIQLSVSGIAADSLDAINAVYEQFPTMIYITCGIVLVFVAFAFGSILIPIRAMLTIILTLAWVYGFADLTYEHGILDFLHFYGLEGVQAVMWLAPVVSFSIIVGIGLDYDIFLLVRTREYRMEGHSTPNAILLGLQKTGRIITAAGVIMAIAFSGLLFSSIPSLNQLAFFLVFAVLFDTFVVRSSLVPALMGILGEANWWPSRMPPVLTRSLEIN